MKTLYLDCGMGAAGDMLTAALLELLPEREKMVEELNGLGIPGVEFSCEAASKCGIGGTHVAVRVHGAEESEEMQDTITSAIMKRATIMSITTIITAECTRSGIL